jgi:hypothetical protein
MNHWLETSKHNLLPLSQAESFSEALKEWLFTGLVLDYDGEEIECELCEHPDLAHHFEIQNTLNKNRLLVGSSCILKFSEIRIRDSLGREIIDSEERRVYLEDTLQKKLSEIMLEPLRKLWRKDKENRSKIRWRAETLKRGEGISPQELMFLFLRMDEFQIPYIPSRYKVSLRSYDEQNELSLMSKANLIKLKPALSSPQQKKYARLFEHEI